MREQATTVSQRNLIQRLNRALARDGAFLRKTNPRRVTKLGSYFLADIASDDVVRENVNLEELAREKGVLAAWEKLEAVTADQIKRADLAQAIEVDAATGSACQNSTRLTAPLKICVRS